MFQMVQLPKFVNTTVISYALMKPILHEECNCFTFRLPNTVATINYHMKYENQPISYCMEAGGYKAVIALTIQRLYLFRGLVSSNCIQQSFTEGLNSPLALLSAELK